MTSFFSYYLSPSSSIKELLIKQNHLQTNQSTLLWNPQHPSESSKFWLVGFLKSVGLLAGHISLWWRWGVPSTAENCNAIIKSAPSFASGFCSEQRPWIRQWQPGCIGRDASSIYWMSGILWQTQVGLKNSCNFHYGQNVGLPWKAPPTTHHTPTRSDTVHSLLSPRLPNRIENPIPA